MTSLRDIPIGEIAVEDRLRALDGDYVAWIAGSIAAVGLQNPITVAPVVRGGREVFALVAGAHRLAAVARLGRTSIAALVIAANGIERRLIEIDENLCRRDLSALDRGAALAERKAVWLQLYPQTAHGAAGCEAAARKSVGDNPLNPDGNRPKRTFVRFGRADKTQPDLPFTVDAAAKLGMGRRWVEKLLTIHSRLTADVARRLATTVWADRASELALLARQETGVQRRVCARLLTEGPGAAKSVRAALAMVQGRPPKLPRREVLFGRLLATWGRSDAGTRRRFLEWLDETGQLAELLTPPLDPADGDSDPDPEAAPAAAPAVTGGTAAPSANTDADGGPAGVSPATDDAGRGPAPLPDLGTPRALTPAFAEVVRLARDDPAHANLWTMYGPLLEDNDDDAAA